MWHFPLMSDSPQTSRPSAPAFLQLPLSFHPDLKESEQQRTAYKSVGLASLVRGLPHLPADDPPITALVHPEVGVVKQTPSEPQVLVVHEFPSSQSECVTQAGVVSLDVQTCAWSNWQPDPLVQSARISSLVQSLAFAAVQISSACLNVLSLLHAGTSDSPQTSQFDLFIHPLFAVPEQQRTSWRSFGSACLTLGPFQSPFDDPPTTSFAQPGTSLLSQIPFAPQVSVVQLFPSSQDASSVHGGIGVDVHTISLSNEQPEPAVQSDVISSLVQSRAPTLEQMPVAD